jgi:cytochrome c-type biogenesis protein CcmH/NrfF
MTTGTGLILWAFSVVFIALGAALTIGEIRRWAVARRARRRRARINYERRLRAAVARHPAGRNR